MSGDDSEKSCQKEKKNNILPLWGNERSMNLNPLILTNIQSSHYFKVNLYELKTYHEVIDEIYYKVTHLEPWEKGSRKTAGQTGMCGGVRGVGAGGIVSTAYCLLYKLFTLKLTRKQVNGLLIHPDSPYIRALGFMYIRYTQPPADLWDWYDEYLEDPEEMDVKAGGGQVMKLGDILRHYLTKLEWFSTLFPRIPVPIQQKLERQLGARFPALAAPPVVVQQPVAPPVQQRPRGHRENEDVGFGEAERVSKLRRADGEGRSPSSGRSPRDSPSDRPREHRGEKRSRPSSPVRKHHRGHEDSPPRGRHDSPPRRHARDHESSPVRSRHRHEERRYDARHEQDYRHDGRDRYEKDGDGRHDKEEVRYEREDRHDERHERKKERSNGQSSSRHHKSHRGEEHSSRRERSGKDFASELMREKERQRKDKSRSSPVRS